MTFKTTRPTVGMQRKSLSMTLAAPLSAITRHDCPHMVASGVFVVLWNQIEGHQVRIALCPACEQARRPVAMSGRR